VGDDHRHPQFTYLGDDFQRNPARCQDDLIGTVNLLEEGIATQQVNSIVPSIIPGNLRHLHCGGCFPPIMRALRNAMKKGNRPGPKFLLYTIPAIPGIQRIIAVLKIILRNLSRHMRSALKDSMTFSGLM